MEDGTLTSFDTPELMCSFALITLRIDDVVSPKSVRYTPEPRKVGCPFWYYFKSKLKEAEKKENRKV